MPAVERPKHLQMKFVFLLVIACLALSADAESWPVLTCVNKNAEAGLCTQEIEQATQEMIGWFEENAKKRNLKTRQLVDCGSFCEETSHFSFAIPCNCQNRRLAAIDGSRRPRRHTTAVAGPLEGPVQLFQSFVKEISGSCRDVFEQSHCWMTFVEDYSNNIDSHGTQQVESIPVVGDGSDLDAEPPFAIDNFEDIDAPNYNPDPNPDPLGGHD